MSGFFVYINITMANAFTNFLGSVAGGIFGSSADLKDYQHADRLYVRNLYARAPKVGFLYFVTFNINKNAIIDQNWNQRKGYRDVGLLVKKMDLPKFTVNSETLNQYNRKNIVHTKITYNNVNIEFHDDNNDITTDLWKNYYNYYFRDGVYKQTSNKSKPIEFSDTKFGVNDYFYGLDSYQTNPFLDSVDVYVMHKGKGQWDFTQITLLNPKITDWTHDSLDQNESSKTLTNRMTLAYEAVNYRNGKIQKNVEPEGFVPVYYDTDPSPLSISGGIPGTLFGDNGVIAGVGQVFGENGAWSRALNSGNPLALVGAAIQTANLAKGASQLNRAGLKTEGYSILSGALKGMAVAGKDQITQPGGVTQAVQAGLNQNGFGAVGNVGVNLFSNQNSSINGTTTTRPKNLTGGSI